jgi:hypothetical protein
MSIKSRKTLHLDHKYFRCHHKLVDYNTYFDLLKSHLGTETIFGKIKAGILFWISFSMLCLKSKPTFKQVSYLFN